MDIGEGEEKELGAAGLAEDELEDVAQAKAATAVSQDVSVTD